MIETWARRDSWDKDVQNLENIPDECRRAVELITGQLSRQHLDAYRDTVMSIAVEVAKAYREPDGWQGVWSRLLTRIVTGIETLLGFLSGQPYDSKVLLNISYSEDVALSKLSSALSIGTEKDSVNTD